MVRPLKLLVTLLVAAAGCDRPTTTDPAATVAGTALQASRNHDRSPVALTGTVTYWTYAPKIRALLQDAPFVVPTPGTSTTLEFLGRDSVRLQLHEDHSATGEGDRSATLEGRLFNNGEIVLDYVGLGEWAPGVPFLVGLAQWHSGCTITSGDFPTYHGRFNGERLVAATEFTSVCPGPSGTPDNPLFAVPVLGPDGQLTPVDWAWKLDLRIVAEHGMRSR